MAADSVVPHFRSLLALAPGSLFQRIQGDCLRRLIASVLRPEHFFAENLRLEWLHLPEETVAWEVYRGHLLDAKLTHEERTFESWNIFRVEQGNRSAEPILSVKLDADARQLYVTRAICCYVWEGYDAGNSVFLSREVRKWVRELVAAISLDHFRDPAEVEDELIGCLFHAVVGSSRLSLTSEEAPLSDFSLGQLAYFHRAVATSGSPVSPPGRSSAAADYSCLSESLSNWPELIAQGLQPCLSWAEQARLLECLLRAVAINDVQAAAARFADRWRALGRSGEEMLALCRTLFNEVSLSPYTGFVEKFLLFLSESVLAGYISQADRVDFLSHLLRQIGRHLTAYDLITFHHRGANYPDALLLEAVLTNYLAVIEAQPELFRTAPDEDPVAARLRRLRRRALRQAYLLRLLYEGLPVPDAPTSPGENSRVLPPPYRRVPEEQILVPSKRSRRLFSQPLPDLADTSVQAVMAEALADLQAPSELRELGMALFLDRPLGRSKSRGEIDQTVLLSYEAFSPSIACRRLHLLAERLPGMLSSADLRSCEQSLPALGQAGLPLCAAGHEQRPGSVSLADAFRVADDFRLLRTTRGSAHEFQALFDFAVLESLGCREFGPDRLFLVVDAAAVGEGPPGTLLFYNRELDPWLEAAVDLSAGYHTRAGREFPAAGLRVLRLWTRDAPGQELREKMVSDRGVVLRPLSGRSHTSIPGRQG